MATKKDGPLKTKKKARVRKILSTPAKNASEVKLQKKTRMKQVKALVTGRKKSKYYPD